MNPLFSRDQLEVWRTGTEWRHLHEHWMNELEKIHGRPAVRLRRRGTRHAKELGDEVLPLAKWLSNNADVRNWEAKFCQIGSQADAFLRKPLSGRHHSLQIVTTLDGKLFAQQVHELNSKRRTSLITASGQENDDQLAEQTVQRIESKSSKGYPSDFWLLVAVEDAMRNLTKLSRTLSEAQVAAQRSPFTRVYLVGMFSDEPFRARQGPKTVPSSRFVASIDGSKYLNFLQRTGGRAV